MKKLNWNTILLTAIIGLTGWIGKEVYAEIRATHDSVLILQHQMSGYDVALTDLKARVAAVELEIQKMKEKIRIP